MEKAPIETTLGDLSFVVPMWFVTLPKLNRDHRHVLGELGTLGFWSDSMAQVQVWLRPFAKNCFDWQDYGSTGDIHIPAVAGPRILAKFGFEEDCSLRQLLRHEWAHALALYHHHLVANREFRLAFDGSHDCGRPDRDYCPTRHISPYASTESMEDFAENFMHFVKHRGVLPVRWQTPQIVKRWAFVCGLQRTLN
jgi:hypothetical protein